MRPSFIRSALLVVSGFGLGLAAAQLPEAVAATSKPRTELSSRPFAVSIDEIKQNFVFGELFSGSYEREFTLSDGSKRIIKLTPMIHQGREVVEFRDTGGMTYMGLNGTTTNGTLMVQLRDYEQIRAEIEAQDRSRP